MKLSKLLMLLPLMLVTTGCCIHLWPDPEPEATTKTVRLCLQYAPDFFVWEHLYDPQLGTVKPQYPDANEFPEYPGVTDSYVNIQTGALAEVVVKVFKSGTSGVPEVEESFRYTIGDALDTEIELELPSDGEYDIVAWCHLLRGLDKLPYYDVADFNRLQIDFSKYEGNTDFRDAFRGKVKVETYDDSQSEHIVMMRRPMGKFELITTDLSEFLDRETLRRRLSSRAKVEDYTVVISFPMYYPSSYDAVSDRNEYSTTGNSFRTEMTVNGDSDASLGFEYVFLNNYSDGAGVQLRVDIFDTEGTHVAGSSTISAPMRRDVHTVLRGAFLRNQSDGGVGIDPSYNGDHNVIM